MLKNGEWNGVWSGVWSPDSLDGPLWASFTPHFLVRAQRACSLFPDLASSNYLYPLPSYLANNTPELYFYSQFGVLI